MAEENDNTHATRTLIVEVSPAEVDAGADLNLKVKVSSPPSCDLRGEAVLINDQDGALVQSADLIEFDGEDCDTGEFVVKAPLQPGDYAWSAVLPELVKDGNSYEDASEPLSFTVTAHKTSVAVWDIPTAIVGGEKFKIRVGISCSSGCELTDSEIAVFDHEGAQLATAASSGEPWSGTAALYFAEIELEAPAAADQYKWDARVAEPDSEFPHSEGASGFGVTVVPPPECLVTVEVIDKDKQTPIEGAKVVMHPYRAFSDKLGVAEMRVPKGEYNIFVSGSKYCAVRTDVDVTGDMTSRAELDPDLEPTEEEFWS